MKPRMLVVYMSMLFLSSGSSSTTPILPLFAIELGATKAFAGFIISAFAILRITTNLPVGTLIDRFGPKPIQTACALILFFSAIIGNQATSYYHLLIFRGLQGMCVGSYILASWSYIVLIVSPKERGRIMNTFLSFQSFGLTIGPFFGGLIAKNYGYRGTFVFCMVMSALSFLGISTTKNPKKDITHNKVDFKKETEKISMIRFIKEYRRDLLKHGIILAILVYFSRFYLRNILEFILPVYFDSLGMNPAIIGFYISVSVIISAIIGIPSGWLTDKIGKKPVLVPGMLIIAISTLLYPFGNGRFYLLLLTILYGFGSGLIGNIPPALIADNKPRYLGSTMAILRIFGDIALILGPLISGILLEIYNMSLPFIVSSLVMISGTALVIFVFKESKIYPVQK